MARIAQILGDTTLLTKIFTKQNSDKWKKAFNQRDIVKNFKKYDYVIHT